ncbi:MAG TPA: cupin domain-containing protein [Capsulimonadaceae bacterium]|jgi:N-acetylneuraminate synthase
MKRSEVVYEQKVVRDLLESAGIPVTVADSEIEIADFGLGHYREEGLGVIVRVNEPEYCSKWLTLLPGQACPWHFHKKKKETFFVHSGEVEMSCGSENLTLKPGDRYTIGVGTDHTFSSKSGAVIEEVSTHDENSDSYFRNENVVRDPIVEED